MKSYYYINNSNNFIDCQNSSPNFENFTNKKFIGPPRPPRNYAQFTNISDKKNLLIEHLDPTEKYLSNYDDSMIDLEIYKVNNDEIENKADNNLSYKELLSKMLKNRPKIYKDYNTKTEENPENNSIGQNMLQASTNDSDVNNLVDQNMSQVNTDNNDANNLVNQNMSQASTDDNDANNLVDQNMSQASTDDSDVNNLVDQNLKKFGLGMFAKDKKDNTNYSYNLDDLFTKLPGNKGSRGEEGNVGKMGEKGQKGNIGAKGDKGNVGPRGNIGPQGPPGDTGLIGVDGVQGMPGLKGDRGIQGLQGEKGITGDKGDKGLIGPLGPRGEKGDKGDKGDVGEYGYKGIFTLRYDNCYESHWTRFDTDWILMCPTHTYMTKLETRCSCSGGTGIDSDITTPRPSKESCGYGLYDKDIPRDCVHRIKCCPFDLYDMGERKKLIKERIFANQTVTHDEIERFINLTWIRLMPFNFTKTKKDYPKGYFKEVEEEIEDEDKEIHYALSCDTKFCSKIGQLCVDKKICLDKINEQTECFKKPCWHDIKPPTSICEGSCSEDSLGQHCISENKVTKICNNKKNKTCKTPPCWNNVPVIEKCKGNRCPTPGQQCSIGAIDYNMPGYICKNEVEKTSLNSEQWCYKPPCWHSAPQLTDYCPDGTCAIIGQKCGDPNNPSKICLNKSNDNCLNPPCWHNIPDPVECDELLSEPEICKRSNLKNVKGEDIIDSQGRTINIFNNCTFSGDCKNIGQKCTINGQPKYECMPTHKFIDFSLESAARNKCNKKPCWIPTDPGADLGGFFDFLRIVHSDSYKIDNKVNALMQQRDKTPKELEYQFTNVDREGHVNYKKLEKYFQDNWRIFEANAHPSYLKYLFGEFTGNDWEKGIMKYDQFNALMRSLNVDNFKYRDKDFDGSSGGRIRPIYMPFNVYDAIRREYPDENEIQTPDLEVGADLSQSQISNCEDYIDYPIDDSHRNGFTREELENEGYAEKFCRLKFDNYSADGDPAWCTVGKIKDGPQTKKYDGVKRKFKVFCKPSFSAGKR